METLLKNLLKAFIFPPGVTIILIALGLILVARGKRIGIALAGFATLALYLFSTPYIAYYLSAQVETVPALNADFEPDRDTGAIVVLAGGKREEAAEYAGHDTVNQPTLERMRYGAELHERWKLPILVTGGNVLTDGKSEGQLMADVFKSSFRIDNVWVEGESRNTHENAVFSARLLKERHIGKVVLVTHASHMPRSVEAFRRAGITVIPAPMGFSTGHPPTPIGFDFLPRAGALLQSRTALHEMFGALWYRLRYYD